MTFFKQYDYIKCKSESIKIWQNQHAHLFRFLSTEDSLKIKKGPRTSF